MNWKSGKTVILIWNYSYLTDMKERFISFHFIIILVQAQCNILSFVFVFA